MVERQPEKLCVAGSIPAPGANRFFSTEGVIMKVQIEIRPGEGGADAKSLVSEQARVYLRAAERTGLRAQVIDEAEG